VARELSVVGLPGGRDVDFVSGVAVGEGGRVLVDSGDGPTQGVNADGGQRRGDPVGVSYENVDDLIGERWEAVPFQ
jgi:hypothetical protein